MILASDKEVRNGFSDWSTGSSQGCYYSTKGHAVNAFDGFLQGYGFCLDRLDIMDFYGDDGRKGIAIRDEFENEVGRAILSWYRMPSGNYEFTGYIA